MTAIEIQKQKMVEMLKQKGFEVFPLKDLTESPNAKIVRQKMIALSVKNGIQWFCLYCNVVSCNISMETRPDYRINIPRIGDKICIDDSQYKIIMFAIGDAKFNSFEDAIRASEYLNSIDVLLDNNTRTSFFDAICPSYFR